MNILLEVSPSRHLDFLNIADTALLTRSGKDADLFVGKNASVTITLTNGKETKFRDVVVLGQLVLESFDPENTTVKPHIIARNFFNSGNLQISNVYLESTNFYQSKNIETFRHELRELVIEWLSIQRESVQRLGLQSILV